MKFVFGYTAIRVRDLDRSVAFYRGILGMRLRARFPFPETRGEAAYLTTIGSNHLLEVNSYAEDSPVAGPYREGEELDHLAFEVEDLDAALDHLGRQGHPRVLGPIESRAARWAYVRDPDGIFVEVYERKGARTNARHPARRGGTARTRDRSHRRQRSQRR